MNKDKSLDHKQTFVGFNRKIEQQAEEIRKLRDELNDKDVALSFWQNQPKRVRKEIEGLKQDREKLIEGLRWYADVKNYEFPTRTYMGEVTYLTSDCEKDGGKRARNLLVELGVTVE